MHWAETFVGIPYAENDCAQFAARVQREVFGKHITLPSQRAAGYRGQSAQLVNLRDDYATPTDDPIDGDAVLMVGRGYLNHIGVFARIDSEPWVLHAMRNAGHVVLHRVRDLPRYGLTLEGYYRWR